MKSSPISLLVSFIAILLATFVNFHLATAGEIERNLYESIRPSELTQDMIGKLCTVYVHVENFDRNLPMMPDDHELVYRGTLQTLDDSHIMISLTQDSSSDNGQLRSVSIERALIRKLIIKTEQGS